MRREWWVPGLTALATSYRFGSRAGTHRIRARIRREGTPPYELGDSRPVRVTVG